jgi:hypothetical protein
MATTVETPMNLVARALLLLAALFALNSPAAAAWPTPVLQQADMILGYFQALTVDLDALRAGAGGRAAAPISSLLALLGMGLLLLLGVRISRDRR